jgi:hypothetical protein
MTVWMERNGDRAIAGYIGSGYNRHIQPIFISSHLKRPPFGDFDRMSKRIDQMPTRPPSYSGTRTSALSQNGHEGKQSQNPFHHTDLM